MFKIVRPAVGEAVRYYIRVKTLVCFKSTFLLKCLILLLILTSTFSREMPLAELKNKYRKISLLEKARSGWEDEYEVSSKQVH